MSNTKMPVIAALVVGLAGGVLISNYTILGQMLHLGAQDGKTVAKEIPCDETGQVPTDTDRVPTDESSSNVTGSGMVKAVDAEKRKIRVRHDPIKELGWTAMTMEFDVLPGVDLGSIQIGQNIRFSLHPSGTGDYQLGIIQQAKNLE